MDDTTLKTIGDLTKYIDIYENSPLKDKFKLEDFCYLMMYGNIVATLNDISYSIDDQSKSLVNALGDCFTALCRKI